MNIKPTGGRSYGSIPHLPGSRLGPGDYHIHEGQAKIATEKARDKYDNIYVQEKLDGSNVGVAKVDGKIFAITRSGYLANTSKYMQHHYFDVYVKRNEKMFDELLREGERICGEWLAQAHGTRYHISGNPFIAFDIIKGNKRMVYSEFILRTINYDFRVAKSISIGPTSIYKAISLLSRGGYYGALDAVEGAIWRVERNGQVDFLTKYVRHDKQDGCYLPEHNGTGKEIWNVDISQYEVP